jgi:CheY-like chemotaxis protein
VKILPWDANDGAAKGQGSIRPLIEDCPSLEVLGLSELSQKHVLLMEKTMPGTKPRVLIADDEAVIADTLATILSHAGFETQAVYSGEEALEMVHPFTPDMLISDVIMQGISGIEMAIKVRTMLPSCKILLFSGQACTANLLQKARAQGHEFEILTKPIHPSDLLARLHAVVPDRLSVVGPGEVKLFSGLS